MWCRASQSSMSEPWLDGARLIILDGAKVPDREKLSQITILECHASRPISVCHVFRPVLVCHVFRPISVQPMSETLVGNTGRATLNKSTHCRKRSTRVMTVSACIRSLFPAHAIRRQHAEEHHFRSRPVREFAYPPVSEQRWPGTPNMYSGNMYL